jgi:hypothetical protein
MRCLTRSPRRSPNRNSQTLAARTSRAMTNHRQRLAGHPAKREVSEGRLGNRSRPRNRVARALGVAVRVPACTYESADPSGLGQVHDELLEGRTLAN